MEKRHLEIKRDLEPILIKLKREIEALDENVNTIEDEICFDKLYFVASNIESYINSVEYFEKPIRYEGVLIKNQKGRYELDDIEITSGNGLEVYDDKEEKWKIGRIYYANGNGIDDYYFCDKANNHIYKIEGMKARKR